MLANGFPFSRGLRPREICPLLARSSNRASNCVGKGIIVFDVSNFRENFLENRRIKRDFLRLEFEIPTVFFIQAKEGIERIFAKI